MLLEEIRTFLRGRGVRLNTDLGQHFLIDQDSLMDIVCAGNLSSGDRIVEIGPGVGILTRELLKRVGHVDAVEIDPRMVPLLLDFTGNNPKLTVIQGNALHVDLPIEGGYKVVANIPYHITSPLLHRFLLELPHRPESLTLLIQREVAENICSKTTESMLTTLVHLFGAPELVRLVQKDAFLPPPEVESAVIHITCFKEPLVDNEEADKVLKLVKHAMSQRRKMLSNTIGSLPGGTEAMVECSIDPSRRPQTMTAPEWIQLRRALEKRSV